MPKPTIEEILVVKEWLEAKYKKRNSEFDELDKLYWLDFEKVPDVENVVVGTPHHEVNLACDILAAGKYNIVVPPRAETKKDKERADKVERWLLGLWYRNQKETRRNVIADLAWHGAVRGWLVLKVLYDQKRVERKSEEYEEDGKKGTREVVAVGRRCPLIITARNPYHIFPEITPEGVRSVVEVYKRTARDVKASWPNLDLATPEGTAYEPDQEVEWVEYWDEKYRCYLCDGKPVLPGGGVVAHGYGFIPYAIQFWRPVPVPSGEHMGLGLLYGVKDLVKNVNVLMTEIATAVTEYIDTAWMVWTSKEGYRLDLRRGATNVLNPEGGEHLAPIQRANLPPDVQYLLSIYRQYIDLGLFPQVMAGQPPGGVTAGYAISLLTHGGRLKLTIPQMAIEEVMGEANEMALQLLEKKIGTAVEMRAYRRKDEEISAITEKLSPKDVDGYYTNFVTLSPDMPQDEIKNVQIAMMATQGENPMLSRETAFTKYLRGQSWTDEVNRILIDQALGSEELKKLLALEALRKQGYTAELSTILGGIAASAAAQGGGVSATPGQMPPMPGPPGVQPPIGEPGFPSQVLPPIEQGIPPIPPEMGEMPMTQREVRTGRRSKP